LQFQQACYNSAAGMGEGCAGGSASAGLPDWPAIQEIRGTGWIITSIMQPVIIHCRVYSLA